MAVKKRISILLVLAVAVVAVGIVYYRSLQTSDEPYDLPQIEKRGILHIVTDYNSIGYYATTDTLAGFNHDLLNEIAKYSHLKFDVQVENNLEKSIEDLKSGKIDLLARNIPVNVSLQDQVAFTKPIARNRLVLVQRKPLSDTDPQPVRSLLKLAKATIYIPKASPAKLRLENLSDEIGDSIFVKEDDLYEASQLVMKVAAGEIQFTVCDAGIAENMAKKIPEIDIKTDIGFTHFESWAVRKSSPVLLDSLNAWIERSQQNNQLETIHNKYYKQ